MLKNLSRLTNRPKALRDKVFDRLFEEAEIARFTPRELREYEDSRKAYRDLKNSLDTALRQGRAEGMIEMAKNLRSLGVDVRTIMQGSGVTGAQIEQLSVVLVRYNAIGVTST